MLKNVYQPQVTPEWFLRAACLTSVMKTCNSSLDYGHCHHQLSIKPFYMAPASRPAVFLAIILRAQLTLSQIEIKASKTLAKAWVCEESIYWRISIYTAGCILAIKFSKAQLALSQIEVKIDYISFKDPGKSLSAWGKVYWRNFWMLVPDIALSCKMVASLLSTDWFVPSIVIRLPFAEC